MTDEALERITALAAEIAGVGIQEAAAAASAAAEEAMAWCRRKDIPPGMESVVARLAADMLAGTGAESITEGDISVTFGERTALERDRAALSTFRRIV